MEEPGTSEQQPLPAEEQAKAPESPAGAGAEDITRKLAEAEKQAEYYKDLVLRKVAEFDNYKKRVENDSAASLKYARTDIIQRLLPVVDDFERSLKLSKDRRETEAFTKGVEMIYQKLVKFLDSQGVKEIESLGKEFDVHYHDALLQVPRGDVPPHVVIEVVEKGYSLDDRVLRHAKVVVSTAPADHGSGATGAHPSGPDSGTAQKLES